jgi:hypothetical protein
MRNIFRYIPFVKKIIKKPSTLQTRLEVWATCFASLHRTITGMLSLDHHHAAFVGQRRLINVRTFAKIAKQSRVIFEDIIQGVKCWHPAPKNTDRC